MPRYYCDYCDTYLTHDSLFLLLQPSVRKQHNAGYKHKANVRSYYQQFEEQQTQSLIDQRIKEHLGQTAAFQQVGAAYNQHLASFPAAQRPRLPLLPTPILPIPGTAPLVPGIRPPVLPLPVSGAPGYGAAPTMPPMVGAPGAPMPMSVNGMQRPPSLSAPTMTPSIATIPTSNGASSMIPPSMYQANPGGATTPPSTIGTGKDAFPYPQASEANH